MREQGIYQPFVTTDEFESKLYQHLDIKIDELLSDKLPLPATASQSTGDDSLPWCRVDHPDTRLRTPIVFGDDLHSIATGFEQRVQHCIDIGGFTNDNFLVLGGHIFYSASHAIDDILERRPYDVPVSSRALLRSVTQQLRSHGDSASEYSKKPWGLYYREGLELAKQIVSVSSKMN